MKHDFRAWKRKLVVTVIVTAVLALLIGWLMVRFLIDGVLQSTFADSFITFCLRVLRMDWDTAYNLYNAFFRQNKQLYLAIGYFAVLLLLIYLALSRMTRYFAEISRGLDRLVEESPEEIVLSPEMESMEKKLNAVKQTLQKRARDALEAEKRKNDLVVYLAHDIKTPLTSVIGYLSLLDEAPDMPPEQKAKYVAITLDKAYRLEQLIDEFFEITRFNLQAIVLKKEMINLPLMLMQLADEFYPQLAPQNKQAVVHTEEELTVYADAGKLARVFNNILKNAIAYSYENSTIEIAAKRQDDSIVTTFANRGKAIPAEKLDSIFEKFYRLDTARSTNTGGAGLGLAIAKEIVHAHGGSISADSNDERTVFTVVLPAHARSENERKS